jgi:hypothetical protein
MSKVIPFLKVETPQSESSFIVSSSVSKQPTEKVQKQTKEKEKAETPKVVDEATVTKLKTIRYCEGQVWEDKSLLDWPESLGEFLFFIFFQMIIEFFVVI